MHTFNPLSLKSAVRFYARELKLHLGMFFDSDADAEASFKPLKGSKTGFSAFVFANGPSLNLLSHRKVAQLVQSGEFDLFCVNSFYKSSFFKSIERASLVLSDPGSWNVNILSSEVLAPAVLSKKIEKFFVPSSQKKSAINFLESICSTATELREVSKQLFFFNDKGGSIVFNRNISPLKPRGYISMTAYKALAIAGYLGYSRIYICGYDNTYPLMLRVDLDNKVYFSDIHFDAASYPNDAIKDYWYANNDVDMARALIDTSTLFACLRQCFGGLPVINLDPDSLTDAFPKSHSIDVYE